MDKIEAKEENIIKKTCKELGLTYRELGERIGYSESNLRKSVSESKVSNQLRKSIEMYLEIKKLNNDLYEYETLKHIIKKISG